jgi:hypothetical protein
VRLRLAVIFLLSAAPLMAQRNRVHLDIAVASADALSDGPMVATENLLTDPNTREILQAGFATQINYRIELWKKGGIFDDRSGLADWYVRVQFDPNDKLYHVVRKQDKGLEDFGGFTTLTGAEAQFGKAFRAPIHPSQSGRYYYNLIIEVQPMLESDLDALQEWLKGPSAPGKANPVSTVRSGVGRLVSRLLGGDKQIYKGQSGTFTVP